MATQNPTQLLPGWRANGDLSAHQYKFVKPTANAFECQLVSAITDIPCGVLQNDPSSAGEDASIAFGGTTKVLSAAAIAKDARVAPAADGRAQTAVSTQFPQGRALQAAGGANELIEIQLEPSLVPLP